MNFKRKIVSAIATGSVLLNVLAVPAFASTTLQISGNGSGSDNTLNSTSTNSTTVTQNNNANITNNVTVNGNSGDNTASKNTNGDVSVSTGDAKSGVKVENVANSNTANVACCNASDTTVKILDNGADSVNDTTVALTNSNILTQANDANVTNSVDQSAKTGGNDANKNTGGDVKIDTGNAKAGAIVTNVLNSNDAQINGCCTGSVKAVIGGNGANSDNDLGLAIDNSNFLTQNNSAYVTNNVDASAYTGKNEAEKNTGGSVTISTGDATVGTVVSTTANANKAIVGSGNPSSSSVMLDILDNGSGSDNNIDVTLSRDNILAQTNSAYVDNTVNASAKTGKNEAEKNTGGDVTIDTGNAIADLGITNKVNFNWASLDCCNFSLTGDISGNGASSEGRDNKDGNTITATLGDTKLVEQGNGDYLDNCLTANPKTGKNEAESNTGGVTIYDPTMIGTGNATSVVDVSNTANSNWYGALAPADWPSSFSFTFSLTELRFLLGIS